LGLRGNCRCGVFSYSQNWRLIKNGFLHGFLSVGRLLCALFCSCHDLEVLGYDDASGRF
jgi:hypothetical protein